jgi:hypothetical protein
MVPGGNHSQLLGAFNALRAGNLSPWPQSSVERDPMGNTPTEFASLGGAWLFPQLKQQHVGLFHRVLPPGQERMVSVGDIAASGTDIQQSTAQFG